MLFIVWTCFCNQTKKTLAESHNDPKANQYQLQNKKKHRLEGIGPIKHNSVLLKC